MASTTPVCANDNGRVMLHRLVVGCLLWAFAGFVQAGDFRVTELTPRFETGLLVVDAELRYELSEKANQALANGLPLIIEQTLRLERHRTLWFNAVMLTQERRYRLQFHALSRRYVLTRLETGESRSFRDQQALLNALGRVEGWPVMRVSALEEIRPVQLVFSTELARDELPRLLRMAGWFDAQWQLRGGPLVREIPQ